MWLMVFGGIMGLSFAILATWVSLARGKALQAAAGANPGPERDALMINIADKFKVQTNSQIVALYVIAAIVTLAPLWQLISPSKSPDTLYWLSGTFAHYKGQDGGALWLRPQDANVEDTGYFKFPLVFPIDQQNTGFATDSRNYLPVTIQVALDPQGIGGSVFEVVEGGSSETLKGSFDYSHHNIMISTPICLTYSTPAPPPGPAITTPKIQDSAQLQSLLQKASEVPVPIPSMQSASAPTKIGQPTC